MSILTATTTKSVCPSTESPGPTLTCLHPVDGLILSPTAHDHTVNYRSATLHLHAPQILTDNLPAHHEEKRRSLANVTNTVTGYTRTDQVGFPDDPNTARTTVIKCKIRAISCKQRMGAFDSGQEPVLQGEGGDQKAFRGVVPCWTQWGAPYGYGRDAEEVKALFLEKNVENERYALGVAFASDDTKIEGLGLRKKTKMR
jgi:hypothetical protein